MHDSNWSIRDTIVVSLFGLFAVGVLAAAIYAMGYSKATHRAEAQNYASQYPADTDERIDNCPTNSALVLRECIEEIIASAHDSQRSEQDLNAQRDMAEWAFWLLVVSALGLGVTAIGTIFLAWQVSLTREAVEDTSEATDAMREANRIAQDTAQAQLRAYLDFDEVMFAETSSIPDTETHKGSGVSIAVRNYGATPARDVVIEFQYEIVDKSDDIISAAESYIMEFVGIAPSDHCRARAFFEILLSRWDALGTRDLRMFIRTKVTYTDIFENPQSLIATFVSNSNDEKFGIYAGSRHIT